MNTPESNDTKARMVADSPQLGLSPAQEIVQFAYHALWGTVIVLCVYFIAR
jgi:hypothetical protein